MLRDARGTPVVLNFRATWCGPCEAGPEAVRDSVEEHEIAYPVVLDTDGLVRQRYNVRGTPTTYIIDAE
ncbi:MAG: TlpA disulfide reductase family protein, partial [Spirochaetaceae bacterium]